MLLRSLLPVKYQRTQLTFFLLVTSCLLVIATDAQSLSISTLHLQLEFLTARVSQQNQNYRSSCSYSSVYHNSELVLLPRDALQYT
jgi:hypothetical protein